MNFGRRQATPSTESETLSPGERVSRIVQGVVVAERPGALAEAERGLVTVREKRAALVKRLGELHTERSKGGGDKYGKLEAEMAKVAAAIEETQVAITAARRQRDGLRHPVDAAIGDALRPVTEEFARNLLDAARALDLAVEGLREVAAQAPKILMGTPPPGVLGLD